MVSAAHIALRAKGSEIVSGSDRPLTFNGMPDCTLGPGMVLLSDPLDFNVPRLGDLAISLYFAGPTGPLTTHGAGLHTTDISKDGDLTAQPAIADATTTESYYWLAGVDVQDPKQIDRRLPADHRAGVHARQRSSVARSLLFLAPLQKGSGGAHPGHGEPMDSN